MATPFPVHFTYKDRAIVRFAAVCGIVMVLNMITFGAVSNALKCKPLNDLKVYEVYRIFMFAVAHKNTAHLVNNFSTVLLLGPRQEERFGYKVLSMMMFVCAASTGIINSIVFKKEIVGANSVVFAFLILYASTFVAFSKREQQTVPFTFFILVVFWFNKEISMAFSDEGTSGLAHIIGGVAGAMYVLKPWKDKAFVSNLNLFIKDTFLATVDSVESLFTGEAIQNAGDQVQDQFADLWDSVRSFDKQNFSGMATSALATVKEWMWGVYDFVVDLASGSSSANEHED